MAISVNWATKVITVPKTDMELIQSTPIEIRKLDLDVFRLALRALEDDAEGMPFPRTHKHETEVTLGGITFVRKIEFINDYTITFEDGQYVVNAVGANSNISDVKNPNYVSLNTANSAGLQTIGSGLSSEEQTRLAFIYHITGGKWKIDTETKQMIFYEDDNYTEVARFNLKDKDGNAAYEEVYERERY